MHWLPGHSQGVSHENAKFRLLGGDPVMANILHRAIIEDIHLSIDGRYRMQVWRTTKYHEWQRKMEEICHGEPSKLDLILTTTTMMIDYDDWWWWWWWLKMIDDDDDNWWRWLMMMMIEDDDVWWWWCLVMTMMFDDDDVW